jgi:polysaccharide deacetylase family protein (PEP-CTERM system associated)
MINWLTIDVEDYFQVAAFNDIVKPSSWEGYESRVDNNTSRILDLLDEKQTKATFFVVGWVADRYPQIVRNIADRGHEVGCHSYWHQKIYDLTPQAFKEDTRRAKDVLESILGYPVYGYRAPTYSITEKSLWALDTLEELGFQYDSSIFPVVHDNYGIPKAPRFRYNLPDHNLVEYPISTVRFANRNIPVSGGGYFRLFPYRLTKYALKRVNETENQPFVFYLHPWEIDPGQPRFNKARWFSRFRHYNNLSATYSRLEMLLDDFSFEPIMHNNNYVDPV